MFTVTLSNGKEFACEPGERLVEGAARAGLSLPHSCNAGRCRTCATTVTAGASEALADETGLSREERDQGRILACVRSPTSDLSLDLEDLGDLALAVPRTIPCRIASLDFPAGDVARVVLRLPPAYAFPFLPGQYIDLIGPGGIRRSYSLARADFSGQRLEIHVRQVEGGAFSAYWFGQARENDLLRLHGPLGTFCLRDAAGRDLVFLATGTGIAPVLAMLEGLQGLTGEAQPASVSVYWGGRQRQDLYLDPLAVGGRLHYVPVLSRAGADWAGARGHVQQALLAERSDFSNAMVYACGGEAMVRDAADALARAGLPARRFFSDAFVSSDKHTTQPQEA